MPSNAEVACERQNDEGGVAAIGVKIGEEGKSAQSRGRRGNGYSFRNQW